MAKSKAVISLYVEAFMRRTVIPQQMHQIEAAIMPLGYTQRQVNGSVGSLRMKGMLKNLGEVTFSGRKQHLFSL